MQDSLKIQEYVEIICSRGCSYVRETIVDLESGREREDYASLDQEHRRQLLRELHSIMAVYVRE